MTLEAHEVPEIYIKWKRGRDRVKWKNQIVLCLGKKGAGKSAMGEAWAQNHKFHRPGGKVVDLFGSRDNESLAWCRDSSPIDDVLLVTGTNVDVDGSWDTCPADKLTLDKLQSYEATTTCNSFYHDQEDRFAGLEMIIDTFWERLGWTDPNIALIREASSFTYSRIKQGVGMKEAKADFIYFQREMRHFGFAVFVDTIRWTSVDKEMRDLADYIIIKKVGHQGFPKDLRFLYKFYKPNAVARMKPDRFIILTDNAAIGSGWSQLPKFHKEEGVNLVKELGLKITKGSRPEESSLQKVGDREHSQIILEYLKGLTMEEVSHIVKRSTWTVSHHVRKHDKYIDSMGYCPRCQRAGADCERDLAVRT